MTIHRRIRERREALGLTLQQVAEELGVSWQTVQQWEREPDPKTGEAKGSTAPRRTRMDDVAKVLKTTVEYLQTGRDPSGGNLDPLEYRLISQYRNLPVEWQELARKTIDDYHKLLKAKQEQREPSDHEQHD